MARESFRFIEIEESDPELAAVPLDAPLHIALHNAKGRQSDIEGIMQIFSRKEVYKNVSSLWIKKSSMLETLFILKNLKNIKCLIVEGESFRSIRDLQYCPPLDLLAILIGKVVDGIEVIADLEVKLLRIHVSGRRDLKTLNTCEKLRELMLYRFPQKNFSELSSLRLKRLELVLGSLRDFSGLSCRILEWVRLNHCKYLRDLSSLCTKALEIEACNNISLDTLCKVGGLKKISIKNLRQLTSLKILQNCGFVEEMELLVPFKNLRLEDLCEIRSLRKVTIRSLDRPVPKNLPFELHELHVS